MANRQSKGYIFFRIFFTFCCFLSALIALWYWGMGGKFHKGKNFFTSLQDKHTPLFYQSIGGENTGEVVTEDERIARMYTLQLQVTNSRKEADTIISNLLKKGIKAFYSEKHDGDKRRYVVYRGLYPTIVEAQTASKHLLANNSLRNKVVELGE